MPEGFIKRPKEEQSKAREEPEELDFEDFELENQARRVVGDYSWGVLEWLIELFEQDERHAQLKGLREFVLFNSLLLVVDPNLESSAKV